MLAPDIVEAILAGRTDQAHDAGEAGAAAAGELGGAAYALRNRNLCGQVTRFVSPQTLRNGKPAIRYNDV